MPWNVKKMNGQYCVMDKTGKQMECYTDEAKANQYKEALYAKAEKSLEHLSASMLEDGGPVIVGVGITNIPHLPLPPMSVIEEEGAEWIKVPFLRKGIFKHPHGNLVFDDATFDKMLDNYQKNLSPQGVGLKVGHDPKKTDALAWFDIGEGGKIVKETHPEFGDLLVGYAKPLDEDALKLIKGKRFKYASVEFRPNYQSTLLKQLSAETLTEILTDDLLDVTMLEEQMEVTISQEEYDALKEKAAKVEKVTELETELAASKAKVVELEAKVKPEQKELQLPEDVKVMLEELKGDNRRLKHAALVAEVDGAIARAQAYRDSNGNAHSPILLETARAAMLGAEVKFGDEVIKLEQATPVALAEYTRKTWEALLKNLPGQMKVVGSTQADDDRSVSLETQYTEDDYKSLWAESM